MTDFEAPSSKRAIEALEDSAVRKKLLTFGMWLTGSDAAAEDLLADAIMCVCDPTDGRPWDPERASLSAHMRIVMTDLAKRERRISRNRREVYDPDAIAHARSQDALADEQLAEARSQHRLGRMCENLRQRLASKPLALQIFDARVAGTERADDLARLFCRTIDEIYEANRQIAYHARVVLAEDRAAEEVEMKERRERAKIEALS